jgi:hypothetical protein
MGLELLACLSATAMVIIDKNIDYETLSGAVMRGQVFLLHLRCTAFATQSRRPKFDEDCRLLLLLLLLLPGHCSG